MKIRVVPRKWFLDRKETDEEKEVFQNWNVISIVTPEYAPKNFADEDVPFSKKYVSCLNLIVLKFHDTERQWDEQVKLMTECDADRIYNFVQHTKDNGKGYLIHCTAGKSRSQAVGYVLNEWFNGKNGINPDEEEYNSYENLYKDTRTVNSLVKRLLMDRFFGGYKETSL